MIFNIVFLGDGETGKTSIIQRVLNNEFKGHSTPTVGIEFHAKEIDVGGQSVMLHFWEAAEQSRFDALIANYLKEAEIVCIVFDITVATSFENVENWVKRAKEFETKIPKMWLIGNKIDNAPERRVDPTEGSRKGTKLSLSYLETSAKDGSGVETLLKEMTDYLATKTGPADVKRKTSFKKRRKPPKKNSHRGQVEIEPESRSQPEAKTRFFVDFSVAEVQNWVDTLGGLSDRAAVKEFVREAELDGEGLRKISPVEMMGVIKDKRERDSFFAALNRMRLQHEDSLSLDDPLVLNSIEAAVGPVIGKVTETSARVLFEFRSSQLFYREYPVTARLTSAEESVELTRFVVSNRPAVFHFANLAFNREYAVDVKNVFTVSSSFRTIRLSSSLSFVVVSCNEVRVTKSLESKTPALNLWREIATLARMKTVELILHIGDQIYGDSDIWFGSKDSAYAKSIALLKDKDPSLWGECAGEVEELYREVYRDTWQQPAQRTAMANASNLMVSDDHEIADDWGEAEVHRDKTSFHYFIGLCAHAVYREYQVQLRADLGDPSLVGKDHFYYVWKSVAFVFIELHTGNTIFYNKDDENKFLGDTQWDDLNQWFADGGIFNDIKCVFFVSPIPIVYVPSKTAAMGKRFEKGLTQHWSYGDKRHEQQKMLDLLFLWKSLKKGRELVILGGDVHLGCSAVIKNFFSDHIHQFVTSPVANDTLTTIQLPLVKASLYFGARMEKEYNWIIYNFVESCNFGIVKVKEDPKKITYKVSMRTVGVKNGNVKKYRKAYADYQYPAYKLSRSFFCKYNKVMKTKEIKMDAEDEIERLSNFIAEYAPTE